jgi:hypothetical protein
MAYSLAGEVRCLHDRLHKEEVVTASTCSTTVHMYKTVMEVATNVAEVCTEKSGTATVMPVPSEGRHPWPRPHRQSLQ